MVRLLHCVSGPPALSQHYFFSIIYWVYCLPAYYQDQVNVCAARCFGSDVAADGSATGRPATQKAEVNICLSEKGVCHPNGSFNRKMMIHTWIKGVSPSFSDTAIQKFGSDFLDVFDEVHGASLASHPSTSARDSHRGLLTTA